MNKKQYVILPLILILFSVLVSAAWLRQGYDIQRSMYHDTGATFDPETSSTIGIFCGTDEGVTLGHSPGLFAPIGDSDSAPDLLLMCGPDVSNGAPHLVMISDNLVQEDQITITSDVQLENDWLPFDFCEYDGDTGTAEICILNYEDVSVSSGFDTFSIIIYSYDTDGTKEFTRLHEWFLNETGSEVMTQTGLINVSNLNDDVRMNMIDCFYGVDPTCYINSGDTVFATNFSANNTVKWWLELGDVDDFFIYEYKYFLPAYSGDGLIKINSSLNVKYINVTTGDIERNFTLTGATSVAYFGIVDCDASDCDPDFEEIIIGDPSTDTVYIYTLEDGDLIESISQSGSYNIVYGWVEDRDNDGNQELCGIFIDSSESGSGDSDVQCEELNFFGFDTLDEEFGLEMGSDTWSAYPIIRSDFNGDSLSDIMVGSQIIYLNSFSVTVDLIDSLNISLVAGGVNKVASIYSLFDQYVNGTGTFLTWAVNPVNNDSIWLTTSGALPEGPVFPNLPEFSLGPVQSIQSPACNNTSISFECTYLNGCATDIEFSHFGLCYDCFNDDSQEYCFTPNEFFLNYDQWECDLSAESGGTKTMYIEIFESGYEDVNESMLYNFTVSDSACYDEGNPGNVTDPVVNSPPEIINIPVAQVPQPFCTNSTVIFNCSVEDCYIDNDNDTVFLVPDCDGDGVFEAGGSLGADTFYCNFHEEGPHTVALKVCDGVNTFCDSIAFSVVISPQTAEDIINGEVAECYDIYIYDPEENVFTTPNPITAPVITNGISPVIPNTQPYCFNDFINFNCIEGRCYYVASDIVDTYMEIDETGDGSVDRTTPLGDDHDLAVTYTIDDYDDGAYNDSTQIFTFNLTYTIINEIGQSDSDVFYIELSNNTELCVLNRDIKSENFVQAFFNLIGDMLNTDAQVFALVLCVFLGVAGFLGAAKKGQKNPLLVGISFFAGLFLILTFAKVISFFIFLAAALITILIIIFKVK